MAVYKRGYSGYSGALTPSWSRFLILPRYAFKGVFRSKLITSFLVGCYVFPLACAAAIYLSHSPGLLAILHGQVMPINGEFFYYYLQVQGVMAFVLTAFVGPGLVSPDLADNALPLYFCRPFSRAEYVLGKMSVLIFLLSAITWAPGLVLFLIQSALAGPGWMRANLWIAAAIVLGSSIRILVFSVLALALSAWIKWRTVAGAAQLAVFFIGAGLAQTINAVLDTKKGAFVDLVNLIATVENHLFRQPSRSAISALNAWLVLLIICSLCLMVLVRKVRAYEVVRG